MLVLKKEPNKRPILKEIECDNDSFYKEIGCTTYQAVYPFNEPIAILCDDDGKLVGKEVNQMLSMNGVIAYDVLCGTFLVVGLGDEDFVSISKRDAAVFGKLFDSETVYPGNASLYRESDRNAVAEETIKKWYSELEDRSEK